MSKPSISTVVYSVLLSLAAAAGSAIGVWLAEKVLEVIGRDEKSSK